MNDNIAIIQDSNIGYNYEPPFNPSKNYPEYPFKEISKENSVYDSIRNMFYKLNMDYNSYGKKEWNPLGDIIKPGNCILIKPNLVSEYNPNGNNDQLITHSSVIRAVLDYVHIALDGKGTIIIGDAPIQDATYFTAIIETSGLKDVIEFYNKYTNIKINIIDFRTERLDKNKKSKRIKLEGDPQGYIAIDLKDDSELYGIINNYKRFRVTKYDAQEIIKHHNLNVNEYLIPRSALNADVIINLPKLKTHRKAGMTCALKNMIGIIGCKSWLPHHRYGSLQDHGDEYLYNSFRKAVITKLNEKRDKTSSDFYYNILQLINEYIINSNKYIPFKDKFFEGSWYGNDTIPRTVIDVNKILFYTNKEGVLEDNIQRKMFIVVDSIIAGEGEGPLEPSKKNCGLLVAGLNPVAVDLVCCKAMGFDYLKMPIFKYALNSKKYCLFKGNIKDIKIISDNCMSLTDVSNIMNLHFIPSEGWKGHIEMDYPSNVSKNKR